MNKVIEMLEDFQSSCNLKPFITKVVRDESKAVLFKFTKGEDTQYLVSWKSRDNRLNKWTKSDRFLCPDSSSTYKASRLNVDVKPIRIRDIFTGFVETCVMEVWAINRDAIIAAAIAQLGADSDGWINDSNDSNLVSGTLKELISGGVKIYSTDETNKTTSNQNGVNEMTAVTTTTTTTTKFASIVERSKTAGTTAVQYQAGKALNTAVMTAVKPKLPMMVRGYADHAAAPIVMALAMAMASEFLPEGEAKNKIVKATDLMLSASMMEGADKFLNIESLVASVFSKLPPEALAVIEAPAAE